MQPDDESRKIVNQNLLHFCAKSRQFKVFRAICESNSVDQDAILSALNETKSPLKHVTNDECMCAILSLLGWAFLGKSCRTCPNILSQLHMGVTSGKQHKRGGHALAVFSGRASKFIK